MLRLIRVAFGGVLVALQLAAGSVSAASVRPLALNEIIDTAAVAFEGTCVGNWSEREANTNLIVTYTTFAVKDTLKGNVPSNYVIKQIGGTLPNAALTYRVYGVPTFVVGENYVVFLAGVSAAGFSSPIGLGQGSFSVLKGATGSEVANGRDFREMMAGLTTDALPEPTAKTLQAAQQPVRRLGLDEFKQFVRARVGNMP